MEFENEFCNISFFCKKGFLVEIVTFNDIHTIKLLKNKIKVYKYFIYIRSLISLLKLWNRSN